MGISLPTQHTVARALTQLPAVSPVGLVLASEANHLQADTTKHHSSFFRRTKGQAQSLGEVLVSAELLARRQPIWVGLGRACEPQRLTRAGRSR